MSSKSSIVKAKRLTPQKKAAIVFGAGCLILVISIVMLIAGQKIATRDVVSTFDGVEIVDTSLNEDGIRLVQIGAYATTVGLVLVIAGGAAAVYLSNKKKR